MEEKEEFDFLKAIYGDNIPDDIKREDSDFGNIVYSQGKPDIDKLIRTALALLS